ncbi:MAG: VTT domain-containing protein [Comamonadaceae bacterium]|nr:VTT domain-containing protein [Comamonadaceae bacterium]
MEIAPFVQHYGLWAVGVGTFLEGESVLLAAAAAAAHGLLHLPAVVAVACGASFLGDQFFFLIGRHYGTQLLERWPRLQPHAAQARALLQRHHVGLILAVRFLYGLRIAGPVAIGMSGVPWLRFAALNLLGALAWACAIAGLGYGLGAGARQLWARMDADEYGLILVVVAAALWWCWRHLHHLRRPRR